MRAGDDGDDAEEDAEEDDGVVVVVLATSRDRREAPLDGLAADAHASEAEADANANGAGDDDDDGRDANGGGGRRREGETRATSGAIGDAATDIRGDEETRAGARERRRRRIAHARDAQRVGAQGWADVGELGTVFT